MWTAKRPTKFLTTIGDTKMAAKLIRKLSTKTVVGILKNVVFESLKAETVKDGDRLDVMTLVGIIKTFKQGESDYGLYTEFKGQFEAQSLIGDTAGQTFRAAKCFLPEVATDLLLEKINEVAEANDGAIGDIQVAVKVVAVVDETANTLYGYEVEPLIDVEEADPLAILKQQAGVALEDKSANIAEPKKGE
jgi:hypothetical protein